MEKRSLNSPSSLQKYQWIIIALIIGLAIFGYGYMSTQQRKAEFDMKMKYDSARLSRLETCKQQAENGYLERWNASCRVIGAANGCTLSGSAPVQYEKYRTDDIANCIKQYGQ